MYNIEMANTSKISLSAMITHRMREWHMLEIIKINQIDGIITGLADREKVFTRYSENSKKKTLKKFLVRNITRNSL